MLSANALSGPIVITMRFSLLLKDSRSWAIAREASFEEYKEALFSNRRLDAKFSIFEFLCLPSLVGQASTESLRLIVFASSEIPEKYKTRLEVLLSGHAWARIVYVDPEANADHRAETLIEVEKSGAEFYAHVRLDDDDALARDFTGQVASYISPEFAGYAVSFGAGFAGVYSEIDKQYKSFWEFYEVKASCGLAFIGRREWLDVGAKVAYRSAYSLGSHKTVDRRCPLIVDSRAPMFIYSIYDGQDTGGIAARKLKKEVSVSEVEQHFSIDFMKASQEPPNA